jgi:hypothetical protein
VPQARADHEVPAGQGQGQEQELALPEEQDRHEPARSRPAAPGRVLAAGPATDDERAGRPLVVRAGAAALTGGVLIAVVAASFGPRFFVADVRALGIGVGVLVAALAVGALVSGRVGASAGPVLIAAGVVAFPVSAGGLLVGSLLVVGGGVVLACVQTAPPGSVAVLETGHLPRRIAAAVLDVGLTVVLVLLLATGVLNAAMAGSTLLVYAVWAAAWAAVTLPLALATGASPGAWLFALRLVAPGGARAPRGRVAVRQCLRGALAVGGLVLVASVAASLGGGAALVAALPVLALLALALVPRTRDGGARRTLLDAASGTVPVAALVRPA